MSITPQNKVHGDKAHSGKLPELYLNPKTVDFYDCQRATAYIAEYKLGGNYSDTFLFEDNKNPGEYMLEISMYNRRHPQNESIARGLYNRMHPEPKGLTNLRYVFSDRHYSEKLSGFTLPQLAAGINQYLHSQIGYYAQLSPPQPVPRKLNALLDNVRNIQQEKSINFGG